MRGIVEKELHQELKKNIDKLNINAEIHTSASKPIIDRATLYFKITNFSNLTENPTILVNQLEETLKHRLHHNESYIFDYSEHLNTPPTMEPYIYNPCIRIWRVVPTVDLSVGCCRVNESIS
jgi:hypothetical protein